ncbi:MAG: hypothetical protein PHG31_04195 [Candidatus Omnitrophica bacterium]|nr:hypothetical protein [Candidatus Omnitrophota bacterium]
MMRKEELLIALREVLNAEEKSIPIYMQHLESAVFWAGWDEATVKRIKESFRYLAQESIRHKGILLELIGKIRRGSRDAF